MKRSNKNTAVLLCGILGCICLGTGDWLMIYGNTEYRGAISWLTEGVAQISPWRNTLAMALAFPGILFYGIALFSITTYLKNKKQRKVYHYLTAFSLTPWLCLHLFYIMILYVFAWGFGNGLENAAYPVAEALFQHLSWVVIVSEALMLPPYPLLVLDIGSGKERFSKRDGSVQPFGFLSAFETVHRPNAGQPVSFSLYQRPDERKYGDLV